MDFYSSKQSRRLFIIAIGNKHSVNRFIKSYRWPSTITTTTFRWNECFHSQKTHVVIKTRLINVLLPSIWFAATIINSFALNSDRFHELIKMQPVNRVNVISININYMLKSVSNWSILWRCTLKLHTTMRMRRAFTFDFVWKRSKQMFNLFSATLDGFSTLFQLHSKDKYCFSNHTLSGEMRWRHSLMSEFQFLFRWSFFGGYKKCTKLDWEVENVWIENLNK